MREQLLSSKIVRVFAFLLGYLNIFVIFYLSYHNNFSFSDWIVLLLSFSVFTAATAFAVVSVWKIKQNNFILKILVKIDFVYLTVTAVFSFIGGVFLVYEYNDLIIPVTFTVYTIIYFFLITVVSNLRDKRILKTIYLLDFFKLYKKSLAGLCLLFMTVISVILFYMAVVFKYLLLGIISVFLLSCIIYICRFLITLSDRYEKVHEEKLKSERVKIELIANVSHDIRTPLTSIINYIDLIKRLKIKNAALSEYIEILENKSQRLKTLAGDLIEASKAGAGDIKVNFSEIDLNELAGQLAGEFDTAFTEAELSFIFESNEEKFPVEADGALLWRIMENIYTNVVKYSQPGTRVYCSIDIDSKNNKVFSLKNVSKEPLNISPDELTERFVRGDVSRTGEGSGLGLYIAKALAELTGAEFVIIINGDLFEVRVIFPQRQK